MNHSLPFNSLFLSIYPLSLNILSILQQAASNSQHSQYVENINLYFPLHIPGSQIVPCGRSFMWSWLWKMSRFLMKAGGCPVKEREFQLSTQQKAWGLQFLSRHGGLKYHNFSPPKHCRSRQESN